MALNLGVLPVTSSLEVLICTICNFLVLQSEGGRVQGEWWGVGCLSYFPSIFHFFFPPKFENHLQI